MQLHAADPAGDTRPRRPTFGKAVRYGAGSIVATACSEVVFLLLYGVFDATTTVSSVLAWLAGAVPNYVLNRSWTWGRRGRPSVRHELLPYLAIVLGTLGLAVVATTPAESLAHQADMSDPVRAAVVAGTFLLVYVMVFVLRFFLFDRLFTRLIDRDHHRLASEVRSEHA